MNWNRYKGEQKNRASQLIERFGSENETDKLEKSTRNTQSRTVAKVLTRSDKHTENIQYTIN